ncbi:DUF3618 domain-containing protein [Micromonospora sp. NPDC050980]|uniref:DUF3618 domain-containing protein n=1 Tax=Micromonospora sp. NPDC050980 TaxID=3155161 RepID=UPI0033C4082D
MSTSPPADPRQIRAEIEQTRADLGATVEALAAKTDLKARAKHSLDDTVGATRDRFDALRTRAAQATNTVVDELTAAAVSVAGTPAVQRLGVTKQRIVEASRRPQTRRVAKPAVVVAAAALLVVAAVVVRRRRS